MATVDAVAVLSSAFRQLSDALHLASVACKDLEYTIPLIANNAPPITSTPAPQPTPSAEKLKRKKDPNEPRRPPSAYLLFAGKARQELVASHPELKPPEIMTKLGSLWSELNETKRRVLPAHNVIDSSSHMNRKQNN
jgi:hypothetical protein